MQWQDCYIHVSGGHVTLGNDVIERRMSLYGAVTHAITDKRTGYVYENNRDDTVLVQSLPFHLQDAQISCTQYVSDEGGLSLESLRLGIVCRHAQGVWTRTFHIYPRLPFIQQKASVQGRTAPDAGAPAAPAAYDGVEGAYFRPNEDAWVRSLPDSIDAFPLPKGHFSVKSVRFFDQTDRNDYLVKEDFQTVYPNGACQLDGNLFTISDRTRGQSLLILRDAPTHLCALNRGACDLSVQRVRGSLQVQVLGSGINRGSAADEEMPLYGSGVAVCRAGEEEALYRAIYRAQYAGQPERRTFIMSNTWGDRSQDTAVCHDFLMKEAAVAEMIGADVVQIDDGWQKGVTSNSKRHASGVWEGYYAETPDFWTVDDQRFPLGLAPLAERLSAAGIQLGLWFSPDSSREICHWQRDVQTLENLNARHSAAFFKLDGVKIRDKLSEKRYLAFLQAMAAHGGRISLNQDITAELRLGYFYEKQHGTLFVENRYTDWGNYYPHNTLKNLWMLSRYIPARKFQFEALNLRRNAHKYEGDPFAPCLYDMDYAFACVMLANPLLWMEMTFVAQEDLERLRRIVAVYKSCREDFFAADVAPIGACPDGASFTGFHVSMGGGGYLLLFREATHTCDYGYALPSLADQQLDLQLLISNRAEADVHAADRIAPGGCLRVRMRQPRSYALFRYTARNA